MGWRIGPSTDEVDYLVIGSGFGGSVMAATLAERFGKEHSVCLFERGKAYPPGSFPRGAVGLGTNFWEPAGGWHGMYDVWSFGGIDAVVASGLGGGSLIYANVMLRKPSSWFTQPVPGVLGAEEKWSFGYSDLKAHYAAVEDFLRVQTLPTELDRHSPKTQAFASQPGTERAPLAVRFTHRWPDQTEVPLPGTDLKPEPYGNIHGEVPRTTCTMCAECDIGCNDGAKSSMDHTYLSKAASHGAEICIRTEVRCIKKRRDATDYLFDVHYVVHNDDGESDVATIRAKRVILAAGSINTTYLMLKSLDCLGVPLEQREVIGSRFSGNGDLLGFAVPRNVDNAPPATRGPVITTYRRHLPGKAPVAEPRMFLQDGGIPALANLRLRWSDVDDLLRAWVDFLNTKRLQGGNRTLAVEPTQSATFVHRLLRAIPVLGMGCDTPDGHLCLQGDRLTCSWNSQTSAAHFNELCTQLSELSAGLNADFVANPQYTWRKEVITVHPLGGCPADTSRQKGVVDSYGRVRGVPGLWIVDGSVMPGPIGANPSLTIAAFARRAAMQLREEPLQSPSTTTPFTPAG
ncbi:GMC family oxidoreductase [Mycolicibacterium sp. BiH015]|uniref:GMC oxidoreductase n=1 Tax=Mycolicibacterium sp. BiH015 TaxID=3018808 RepID=UPI0022E8ACBD|nr:GMC family oxidoreductase [Mycolicibacterium sp. BiH015]MDA2893925.1 GMC family oxidoreductase [Mycolicibacterium sp. BiH015]